MAKLSRLGGRIEKALRVGRWNMQAAGKPAANIRVLGDASQDGVAHKVYAVDEPCFIEPEFGYAITESGRLLEETMKINGPRKASRPYRYGVPSPSDFERAKREKTVVHKEVVSLRHWWEWNYFHFLVDTIGQAALLEEFGIDPSIPWVIGKYATEVGFVKAFLSREGLAKRPWIVQTTNYVAAERVIVPYSLRRFGPRLCWLADQIGYPEGEGRNRRIFLERGKSVMRRVENQDDLLPVLERYGFETVDTARMPIDDQIALFAETRYLVAVHGAGMANMVFRQGRPMSVVELRASRYHEDDLAYLAGYLGFPYIQVPGEAFGRNPQHANFRVDPGELETRIAAMLNA